MSIRERELLKALLDTLDQLDGTPVTEPILHASLMAKFQPPPTLAEFERALRHSDTAGWLIGLPSKVTGQTKWTISDKGRAALQELP